MAYCLNTDVQAEFKNLNYVSSGGITSGEVDTWIGETDAYINARISLKYSTPITNATDLLIMKTISVWLTADRVKKRLTTLTGVKGEQSSEPEEGWAVAAEKRLEAIVTGMLPLANSTLTRSNDGVDSYSYSQAEETEAPVFSKGVDQW